MFAYCDNNPVMLSDPDGTCPICGLAPCLSCNNTKTVIPTSAANPKYSIAPKKATTTGVEKFKNKDGSYSLYDNRRNNPDSVFHEQILSVKVTPPSISLKDGKVTLGSYKASLMTGGWEWKYADLSLFNFGNAKLSAGYHEGSINVSAIATAWDPSITLKIGGIKISFIANIGSIGGEFNAGTGGFKASAAFGLGAGISVDWK